MIDPARSAHSGIVMVFASLLCLCAAPAAAQSVLSLLAVSMNRELPRNFGNHTQLVKVGAEGDTLSFDFQVAPESPLAKGLDVRGEAAKLCRVEMFRGLMATVKARLHVAYYRLDRSLLGEFTIDRTTCGS